MITIPAERIGFDFDGVIADTGEAFVRLACEKHDFCSFTLQDITSFMVEECLNIPVALVETIFTSILEDSLATGLQPMPGALETIGRLSNQAPVTIITARPLRQPVEEWLDHFLPDEVNSRVTLVAMGDHDDKARYIREHGLDYFVDDRSETCHQLHAADIQPLVFSQPWNHGRHQFPTVKNWQEIEQLLLR